MVDALPSVTELELLAHKLELLLREEHEETEERRSRTAVRKSVARARVLRVAAILSRAIAFASSSVPGRPPPLLGLRGAAFVWLRLRFTFCSSIFTSFSLDWCSLSSRRATGFALASSAEGGGGKACLTMETTHSALVCCASRLAHPPSVLLWADKKNPNENAVKCDRIS